MRYLTVIFLIVFLSNQKAICQVTLLPGTVTIHPVYSKQRVTQIDTIPIKVRLDTVFNASWNTLTFDIRRFNLPNNPVLINPVITITQDRWNRALNNGRILDTLLFLTTSNILDTLQGDEIGHLQITGKDDYMTIRLSDRDLYNPNKPFWIEVGSNFDFIDGLEPNNFFAGVFLHKRDIRPFQFRKKNHTKSHSSNLGIFAGVFESKAIATVDKIDLGVVQYYDKNSLVLKQGDSVGVFSDSATINNIQVVKNIGLFFSPQIRLTNGSANIDGLHVSASLWLELQWQRISYEVQYSNQIRVDTLYRPVAQLYQYSPKPKKEIDIRSHYFGIGLPVFFKENDANVFFNPVIGISNQPSGAILKNLREINDFERKWNLFYVFQFRLNEEKYGIAFTGEVRGLLQKNSPPFVSLALSKKFDLKRFIEFK
ncbi:hypothetical protein QNI19_19025 [Cytophagaceae bacterium DM2B3-1]|uniref:DUF5723 domain-containing protein n=1 Tax=Xanthocytophaga flava TaxID=3048013 RepID=A0ABT7CMX9_9BACT|nr:hypothetical protein [Xanthocytophaga flavus]MDJ1495040.1 hypothetical protein [Xanthocytophaga flavus]